MAKFDIITIFVIILYIPSLNSIHLNTYKSSSLHSLQCENDRHLFGEDTSCHAFTIMVIILIIAPNSSLIANKICALSLVTGKTKLGMFKSEGSENFRENQAFALWAIKGQPCLKVMGRVLHSKQSLIPPHW